MRRLSVWLALAGPLLEQSAVGRVEGRVADSTGEAWRTVSSPNFGQFNAAGSTRKIQFALRLAW
jgi:hypothetical protein